MGWAGTMCVTQSGSHEVQFRSACLFIKVHQRPRHISSSDRTTFSYLPRIRSTCFEQRTLLIASSHTSHHTHWRTTTPSDRTVQQEASFPSYPSTTPWTPTPIYDILPLMEVHLWAGDHLRLHQQHYSRRHHHIPQTGRLPHVRTMVSSN